MLRSVSETNGERRVAMRSPRRTGAEKGAEVQVLDDTELRQRLEILRVEHRDLDAAIDALRASGTQDQLQLARLKKRKLRLKDEIALIEDWLLPDIIA